jgi:citrate synthase
MPTSTFTSIFALARTVGWIAQWNEMISDQTDNASLIRSTRTARHLRPSKRAAPVEHSETRGHE